MNRAAQSTGAAKVLLADGYFDFTAVRVYYAMFYALEALLLDRDISL